MKKMTDKRVSVVLPALLAVIFFFISSLFIQIYTINETVTKKYGVENIDDITVNYLFDVKTDDLSQKVFKSYVNGNKKLNMSSPTEYSEERSNFFYTAKDSDGNIFSQNYYTDDYSYHETKNLTFERFSDKGDIIGTDSITVECYLKTELTAEDEFYRASNLISISQNIKSCLEMMILFAAPCICCLFWCLWASYISGSRKRKSDVLSKASSDITFAAVLPVIILCIRKIVEFFDSKIDIVREYMLFSSGKNRLFLTSVYMTVAFILSITVLSIAVYGIAFGGWRYLFSYTRLKKYPLVKGSVIYFIVIQIVKSFAIALYFSAYTNFVMIFLLLEKLITLPIAFKCVKEIETIMEKAEGYVGGDLSSSIDTKDYFKTFASHAEDIKSITDRISVSADEYIQSSKFKAELITNLSHDIKTPLTSILSYAQLLKKENLSPEEKEQFLSVLGKHSVRLKKLMEDLSEVSDATTGKIKVNPAETDLCALIPQIVSGFEERLQKRNISINLSLPKEAVTVMADTRLFWRVIDNLMNNICKYAKDNSVVQISADETERDVTVNIRNESAYKIKASGEELTERFIRADSSRHTEGSGLGLSIAKTLMELMNGTLKIKTDEETFFADVIFLKK